MRTTSRTSKFVSMGTWPIGLSYGNFHETALTTTSSGTMLGETLAVSEVGLNDGRSFLDADDLWHQNNLMLKSDFLDAHPHIAMVHAAVNC